MKANLLLSAPCALVLTSLATGQLPSFYLDVGGDAGAAAPASTFAAAAPVPGAWDSFDLGASSAAGGAVLSIPALVNTLGVATNVELSVISGTGSAPDSLVFDHPSTSGDDAILLDDIFFYGGLSSWRFSNLPAGNYDVITYAMAPHSAALQTTVTVFGSGNGPQNVGGTFAGGYVLGVTHSLHSVTVASGADLFIRVEVANLFDSIAGIQIVGDGTGSQGLGMNYCSAVPNSTGQIGVMTAQGSATVADNNVTLIATQLPMGFGFFLVSSQQGFVTNVPSSQGNLCLGGAIGRYQQQIFQVVGGSGSVAIDLTGIPQPTGSVSVMVGDTWSFQTWHRDSVAGVATSNFSNGLEITFN